MNILYYFDNTISYGMRACGTYTQFISKRDVFPLFSIPQYFIILELARLYP